MRRRDSSTILAMQRQEKLAATEFFENVIDKMSALRDTLEHVEVEQEARQHYCSFDRDKRMIDFVIVFDKTSRRPSKAKVNNFIKHLVQEGFSTEGGESNIFEHLIFIRLHCQREKLVKAGIILEMNLAFVSEYDDQPDYNVLFNFDFLFNDLTRPMALSDVSQRATDSVYNRKPKDITNAERIMVTYDLLRNTSFGPEDDEFGITSLLHKGHLHTCFPLHDGPWEWTDEGPLNDRQVLMKYWASAANWCKLQPINLVKNYFGSEVAFYFAFLGYFNKMLIIPSIAGLIAVLFGVLTYDDERNYKSRAICASNITICPSCYDTSVCHYERLNNECHTSQVAYIFDNLATEVYAMFWCFWSTLMYAKWKRREAVLLFRWNLMDLENEVNIRAEYMSHAVSMARRKAREKRASLGETYLVTDPPREHRVLRILRYCTSSLTIIVLILMILMVLYLAVIVRWWTGKLIGRFDGQFSFQWRILIVTTVGNVFVLLFVCIAEELFKHWAHWVTNFENHRTQEEYDQSYVYKYAVLCFITSYSFLCYTAYLKGRFFSHPGHNLSYRMLGILNYDQEKIHTSMMSVSYQWTMLTVGKEIWHLFMLSVRPWWKRGQKTRDYKAEAPRIWELEYQLHSHEYPFLMEENMKVMLQYGYLVLFPGANPLGPLGYLLFNLWAVRYEAKRTLLHSRRVVATRTAGFGPWLKLIKVLTILGLGTNVFFLAFTSNLVPLLCHWFNPYYTNYVDYTFSQFAVDDYPAEFGADMKSGHEGTVCYYKGKRFPPSSPNKYESTVAHWNLLSIQFLAVMLIQGVTIIFCGLILFAMSDTPRVIKESIRHRANTKQQQREEKFRKEKFRRTTMNAEFRKNFTVIGY